VGNASAGWIPQLDGLRGLSILMVLTAHVYAPGWHELQGGYGVTVFFVLSGFLITRLLVREEHDSGGISLAAFYVRRVFRLFPLYYLILAVYCVLILVLGLRPDGRSGFVAALPWYLTYMQEMPYVWAGSHEGASIAMPFYQSWSLGIEEKFYLVWPFLAFRLVAKQNARIALAVGAVLFFSAARFYSLGRYIYPYAAISWGCLFALLYEAPGIRKTLDKLVSGWRAPFVLLSWPVLHVLVAGTTFPNGLRLFAELAYPLSIAFVILASLNVTWLATGLSITPLVVLGRYSYCIYLIHLLIRQAVERVLHKLGIEAGNGLLVFLLMLLLSTAAASILYYAIESRFREIGRRLSRSWSHSAARACSTHTDSVSSAVRSGTTG
jgi:peptidoglycan/LPS O-acetylase OafA/YrhL